MCKIINGSFQWGLVTPVIIDRNLLYVKSLVDTFKRVNEVLKMLVF